MYCRIISKECPFEKCARQGYCPHNRFETDKSIDRKVRAQVERQRIIYRHPKAYEAGRATGLAMPPGTPHKFDPASGYDRVRNFCYGQQPRRAFDYGFDDGRKNRCK